MHKNIVDKIWDAHLVQQEEGFSPIVAIDFVFLHEVTSAQAFQFLDQKNMQVMFPSQVIATIDHSIPTSANRKVIADPKAREQVALLKINSEKHNIPFYGFDSNYQGIVHVIGPELGITQPGMTIICGDSHTATHGAFGAMAFGVGTTELSHALGTGCLMFEKPKVMKVHFHGELRKGVNAKDIIMRFIKQIGVGGANGYVIEYAGKVIQNMTMEERMTICNMSIECGAKSGLICPDETTFLYLKGKPYTPSDEEFSKLTRYWKLFRSDPNAKYDKEIYFNVEEINPMVTWGINPSQAIGLDECIPAENEIAEDDKSMYSKALQYMNFSPKMSLLNIPVQWAFLGSCTNGRIEDLRVAAKILKQHKVHPSVTFYIVPGSEGVMHQAQKEGLDKIFIEAGAQFRMPGCSMCLGMNEDKVPEGQRCISSTNRNFIGRQGNGSFTHLASPATVTASAIEGKITSPINYL